MSEHSQAMQPENPPHTRLIMLMLAGFRTMRPAGRGIPSTLWQDGASIILTAIGNIGSVNGTPGRITLKTPTAMNPKDASNRKIAAYQGARNALNRLYMAYAASPTSSASVK
jgi:hypothetical protein